MRGRFFYPEEINLAWGFALPGTILAVVGSLLWRFLAPKKIVSLYFSRRLGNCNFSLVSGDRRWRNSLYLSSLIHLVARGASLLREER